MSRTREVVIQSLIQMFPWKEIMSKPPVLLLKSTKYFCNWKNVSIGKGSTKPLTSQISLTKVSIKIINSHPQCCKILLKHLVIEIYFLAKRHPFTFSFHISCCFFQKPHLNLIGRGGAEEGRREGVYKKSQKIQVPSALVSHTCTNLCVEMLEIISSILSVKAKQMEIYE